MTDEECDHIIGSSYDYDDGGFYFHTLSGWNDWLKTREEHKLYPKADIEWKFNFCPKCGTSL